MVYSDLPTISCISDPDLAQGNVSSIFILLANKLTPFKQFRVKDRSEENQGLDLSEIRPGPKHGKLTL